MMLKLKYILTIVLFAAVLLNISYSEQDKNKAAAAPDVGKEWNEILSLIDTGKNEEAKSKLYKFISKYPKSKLIPSALYQLVLLENDVPKATEMLQKIVDEYPNTTWSALAQYKIGDINLMSDNYKIALTAYEKYIKIYPNGQWINKAKMNRAFCLMRLQNYEEALKTLREIQKDNFSFYNNPAYYDAIGECQIMLKQYHDSITTYTILIQRFPEYAELPKVSLYIGLAYEETNDIFDAENTYKTLIETFPSSIEASLAKNRLNDFKILKNLIVNALSK